MSDGAKARSRLFISYSHKDAGYLQRFTKHLATLPESWVWTDKQIPPGNEWQPEIIKALGSSTAALLLITPAFLGSEFVKEKELPAIIDAFRTKRIKKVFWILVEGSLWNYQSFHGFQGLNTQPLADTPEQQLESEVLRICGEIQKGLDEISRTPTSETDSLQRLVTHAVSSDTGVKIGNFLNQGRHSYAFQGSYGVNEAVIQVIDPRVVKSPEDLQQAVQARRQLTNHSFIRMFDAFQASADSTNYLLIVSEFMDERRHKKALGRTWTIDAVATLVRRAAGALMELEKISDPKSPRAYGLLTPHNVYVDDTNQRLRFSSLGLSSYLSVVDWQSLTAQNKELASYIAPEQYDEQELFALNQYMLGQLAFVMLNGAVPISINGPAHVGKKEPFFENPSRFAGPWSAENPQFSSVIFRMLHRDPAQRWPSLADVVSRLRDVEDSGRALAKRAYLRLSQEGKHNQFIARFYDTFFKVSPESAAKFDSSQQASQAQKLRAAIVAVLNFRDANEPTTLHDYLDVHRAKKVTPEELEKFKESFLQALAAELAINADDPILTAWRQLFEPVVAYMRRQLTTGLSASQKS